MRRLWVCLVALIAICCASSGCVTLGPRVKTTFVIVRPGRPIEILQNVTVRGRRLEDESVGRQGIGGWVAMPRGHFNALMQAAMVGAERTALPVPKPEGE